MDGEEYGDVPGDWNALSPNGTRPAHQDHSTTSGNIAEEPEGNVEEQSARFGSDEGEEKFEV